MLKEIICFFNDYDFKNERYYLDKCSIIFDSEKFVKSHLAILTANHSKRTKITYIIYYNRLLKFYEDKSMVSRKKKK